MDSDEEDYVFVGTPIEREEEITNRRKKAAAEASGNLRSLPPWKQEVRDEEGRRRFHGAFTGGFSAGYFNTVGAKEGWAPQSFTSSRKNRAEVKQQNILNFLDEDEKTELEGQYLGTSSQFDTFGFTAAEYARKQADKEQKQRPSAIPGPVPDELVLPASESIDACREARKAFLAFASEDTKAPNPADFEPVEGEPESFIEQPADDDAQSSQSLPPPPSLRMRSKIDSLLFMPNSVKGAKPEEDVIANSDLPVAQTDAQKTTEDVAGKEIEIAVENVERPIDLYKAIFSDDDVEESNSNKVGDSEKNIEVATTTLNRLIADDFLESLGKELGLEVPPDTLYSTNKASNPAQIETPNGDAENAKSIHVEGITFSAPNAVSGTSLNPGQITSQKGEPSKYESIPGSSLRYSSKYIDGLSENISGKVKSPSRHRRNRSSSSSSEDERSRKHSRQHRYRSSDSYSDSSGDHRDCHRSGSKGRRKKSSQENSSSRKHSKHLKHRNRDSPSRSNHGSEREHSEARKEKRKWRD